LLALRTGLPVEDHRHFTARLEIAQSLVAFGQYREARRELERLAGLARAAGREDVARVAELRSIWASYLEVPHGTAERRLIEMSRRTGPEHRISSIGAKMLLLRIYGERRDTARSEILLAQFRQDNPPRRQLLVNPPYQLAVHDGSDNSGKWGSQAARSNMDTTLSRRVGNFEDMWIDVAFWIQPDGRVADLQIVRRSGRADWADPLLQSIRGRRYASIGGTEPTYRLERYTYTAGYESRTGSRIQQRSPLARVEYLDLTGGPPARPSASE
jgi:hypothetical protein